MLVKQCSTGSYWANENVTLKDLCDEFKLVMMPTYLSNPFSTYDVYRRNSQGKPYKWLSCATLKQAFVDIIVEYGVNQL